MREFKQALEVLQPPSPWSERVWWYVPYDQLSAEIGALAHHAPEELGVVLIESTWKAARRPVHKMKLAYVLANQRHFALELAERGVAVDYRVTRSSYGEALGDVIAERGRLKMMRAAERELRVDVARWVESEQLEVVEHEGWLTCREDFERGAGKAPPWRMDRFYRHVRQRTGILMEGGKPAGGKYSLDAENRKPWKGKPAAPEVPRFVPDAITREAGQLIEARFGDHPGALDLEAVPATAADASALWAWACESCMESFGPYEDAMSERSRNLFHTRISPLLNLHRLLPKAVVRDVLALDIPLNSREGFVRQVIGWREFVRHVHEVTDGFRKKPGETGGGELDEGARPNMLGVERPLPPVFWGDAPSGLHCLDAVLEGVWEEGYSHHITRLMVLSNIAMLLDVEPRALTDWFWCAYVDAYDWVVEPNVLAMGLFATGPVMTTKPYVAGSGYVSRMSDYCESCAFHPKKSCPLTPMYWDYLNRHSETLSETPRIGRQLGSARARSEDKKSRDRAIYLAVAKMLSEGKKIAPKNVLPRP